MSLDRFDFETFLQQLAGGQRPEVGDTLVKTEQGWEWQSGGGGSASYGSMYYSLDQNWPVNNGTRKFTLYEAEGPSENITVDRSAGEFEITVAGLYVASTNFSAQSTTNDHFQLEYQINGSGTGASAGRRVNVSSYWIHVGYTFPIRLDVGDKVWVEGSNFTSPWNMQIRRGGNFSIFKVAD